MLTLDILIPYYSDQTYSFLVIWLRDLLEVNVVEEFVFF